MAESWWDVNYTLVRATKYSKKKKGGKKKQRKVSYQLERNKQTQKSYCQSWATGREQQALLLILRRNLQRLPGPPLTAGSGWGQSGRKARQGALSSWASIPQREGEAGYGVISWEMSPYGKNTVVLKSDQGPNRMGEV